jgi:hypothetical protein
MNLNTAATARRRSGSPQMAINSAKGGSGCLIAGRRYSTMSARTANTSQTS